MAQSSIETLSVLREYDLPALDRPRVVGPGRFERGYLQRLSGLSAELEAARERESRLQQSLREEQAALEVSQRVEHGCQRRIDRLEGFLETRTQALLESERQQKRLALALGAMHKEVEMLRARVAPQQLGRGGEAASRDREAAAERTSWWRRMFAKSR